MSDKLKIKDLVTIGIFAVIYILVMFLVGMIGLLPILVLSTPCILGILAGTLIMLFMAKVPKPWVLFIFGMIPPVVMLAVGHTYILPLTALVFIGLAEFFFRKGGFKSFKYNAVAYGFFSCWISGSIIQMLLVREKYEAINVNAGVSPEYFDSLEKFISWPSMALIIIGGFADGIIGAYIGRAMLKKHFEKAGIV